MKISALFTVRNEESRLSAALYEIKPFVDEIVVVDQASTDGTVAIAKEYGAVVVPDICRHFSEASRQILHDASSGDWLLELYADEILTTPFREKLRLLCGGDHHFARGSPDGYGLLRQTVIFLKPGTRSFVDHHHFRLWRRGTADFPLTIHSNPTPKTQNWINLPELAILHLKTAAEQNLDAERYWNECGQVKPEGAIILE